MDSTQRADGFVNLVLSESEALVLFEWLQRNESQTSSSASLGTIDEAEQMILWDMSACLETVLVEPFTGDYTTRVAQARNAVRGPAA